MKEDDYIPGWREIVKQSETISLEEQTPTMEDIIKYIEQLWYDKTPVIEKQLYMVIITKEN